MRFAIFAWAVFAGLFFVLPGADSQEHDWLPASCDKLPLWRGFNLIEKFHRDWRNGPFLEEDFRLISELGFNFVRLPMDYRIWTVDGDWTIFDEEALAEIDDAVSYGKRYGIHVCINFHRAPGYTVANPPEPTDLWTDPETQRVCALHWKTFARRYREVPSERLSFNLFNEPAHIDGTTYYKVVKQVVEAIRSEDPDRLIIADGLQWCRSPCEQLYPLKIAQATRGYAPSWLSHYRASWVNGSDKLPVPVWPRPRVSGWLTAGEKRDLAAPLVLRVALPEGARLRLRVLDVSAKAELVVEADGETIFREVFVPGEGEGEWKESVFRQEWGIYQAVYDRDYFAEIPAGTETLTVKMAEGDWMTLSELGLSLPGAEAERALMLMPKYGAEGGGVFFSLERGFEAELTVNGQSLWEDNVVPWMQARKAGIGVMVGEFGAFRHTPHDVVLRWMEDCLGNWKKAGWGWALWNFRGRFGILDSEREDVEYEEFHGHKLDRKMLDLLLEYM